MTAESCFAWGVVLGALVVGCETTTCPPIAPPSGVSAIFEERVGEPGEYRLVVETSLGDGVCSLRFGTPDGGGGAGGATSGGGREGECVGELGDLRMFLDDTDTLRFSFGRYAEMEDLPEEMLVRFERDGAPLFEETVVLDYEPTRSCAGEVEGAYAEVTLR